MPEYTNADRAAAAAAALLAFANATGTGTGTGYTLENVGNDHKLYQDLLCNLRHLADANGIEFGEADTAGYSHYSREVLEETLTGELIQELIDSDDEQACIRLARGCHAYLCDAAREWSLPAPVLTRDAAREQLPKFADVDALAASLQEA